MSPKGTSPSTKETGKTRQTKMTKKALVCGAGGFIGSHLVKKLKKEGYWVRGVDIKNRNFLPPLLMNLFYLTCGNSKTVKPQ